MSVRALSLTAPISIRPVQGLGARRLAERLAVLTLLALALPWLCHHVTLLGAPAGVVLLPILLPVALAAFLLPLRWALGAAVALPLVSFATSGMPPLAGGALIWVILEGLASVAAITAVVRRGGGYWTAFVAGTLANRAVAALAAVAVATWIAPQVGLTAALGAAAVGAIGLAVHAALLPLLLRFFGARS